MAKKQDVRKSRRKSEKQQKPENIDTNPPHQDREENRFDFGGLPKRDLKKNLGCG